MRINHNIAALNTYRQLSQNTLNTSKSLEKLSSGLRINRAGDDAAGLAISEKMRGQIRGLTQAERNANDGISLIQTAEGALSETHSILQRMRELAVQAGNDTNTNSDRAEMQKEISLLSEEITRISADTEFNTQKLLDGSMSVIDSKSDALASVDARSLENGTYSVAISIKEDPTNVTNGNFSAATLAAGEYTFEVTAADAISIFDSSGSAVTGHGVTVATGTVGQEGRFTIELETEVTDSESTVISSGVTVNLAKDTKSGASGVEFKIDNSNAMQFQIGSNSGQNTSLTVNEMSSAALGIDGIDISDKASADQALDTVDDAIASVSSQRAALGGMQNRLEHTITNIGTTTENLTASESRIRDVDMAQEMMEFTKNNILSQAAQAMLAQANMQPQGVLQLLQ